MFTGMQHILLYTLNHIKQSSAILYPSNTTYTSRRALDCRTTCISVILNKLQHILGYRNFFRQCNWGAYTSLSQARQDISSVGKMSVSAGVVFLDSPRAQNVPRRSVTSGAGTLVT